MQIQIYKSNDLSPDQWEIIAKGFTEAFNRPMTGKRLKESATSNIFGYSYHALAYNENQDFMAYNVIIPYLYKNGIKIGLSGSSFVLKRFRKDIFILHNIISKFKKFCINEGIAAIVGVPNKNSFNYYIKFNNFKYITNLKYYILPVKIANILKFKNAKFLNYFFRPFLWAIITINSLLIAIINSKEKKVEFEIDITPQFLNTRFKSEQYTNINVGNLFFSYRIINESGIKTAYLMDFRENNIRSSRSLFKAIWYILKREKIDIIIFIGLLRLFQLLLFRIPKKYVPQRLPLTYFLLNNKYNSMLNKDNWNFSLLNFDVR